jgi:formylglycine-generating enzyme required for sulfatase activity
LEITHGKGDKYLIDMKTNPDIKEPIPGTFKDGILIMERGGNASIDKNTGKLLWIKREYTKITASQQASASKPPSSSVPTETAQAKAQDTFTNSIGMEFIQIPAGKFTHEWSWQHERNDFGEPNIRKQIVTISKPFYMGIYEVTQEQWVAVMGEGTNPSRFKGRNNPVEQISWDDVQVFVQKLNEKEGGNKYRLPTEAEWEYAARAGTETACFFGPCNKGLGRYAWYKVNAQEKHQPVGQKEPNPWGLYDVYGNVAEWVADWYDETPGEGWYKDGEVTDPAGPSAGTDRVMKGCDYKDNIFACNEGSSARREANPSSDQTKRNEPLRPYWGFRLLAVSKE